MKPKNIAAIVALIIVIIAAVYFGVSRMRGRAKPPEKVLAMREAKVDEKTAEIIVLPVGEWMKLGKQGGKFKNPKTGEYTMCPPMICSECKSIIGAPVIDREDPDKPESVALEEVMRTFRCPKCGKTPNINYRPTPEEMEKISRLITDMYGK